MPTRFIICTNGHPGPSAPTPEERNKITRFFEAKGWQVWHWFDDIWLTVDPLESTKVKDLANEMRLLLGATKQVVVMQIEGQIKYSGYAPRDGWPWMRKNWGTPGEAG
jgi:hypothetical protein